MSGHINPTRESFDGFKALDRETPIDMLNLLRFRDVARYPGDHPDAHKGWSGREAFTEYGRVTMPFVKRLGGEVLWRADFEWMLTGPAEARWDASFIMRFPGANAFFAMLKDPEYQVGRIHRDAALVDSRLMRLAARPADGEGFGTF